MLAVGVGYEYLAELGSLDHAHDTRYAFGVQFVEDVVQEEDGAAES